MKIGKLTIRSWNKWFWRDMELVNPVVILWRMFWYCLMWVLILPVLACAYIGFGKRAAYDVINAIRYN